MKSKMSFIINIEQILYQLFSQQANNDLLHVLSFDKILRNRSNSSPEERKNTMNK